MKFIDLNKSLVDAVSKLGIESVYGDYFLEAYRTLKPVFMTASNPYWGFGGGLDRVFTEHFPKLVQFKQMKGGGMERISNVVFAITVDENLIATKQQIKEALEFAINATGKDETLCIMGCGTGIGGLSQSDFVEVLKSLIK